MHVLKWEDIDKDNVLKPYDYRHDRTNTIHTLCRISEQYRRLGDYDEALTNLKKAEQICKKLSNNSLRVQCLVKK